MRLSASRVASTLRTKLINTTAAAVLLIGGVGFTAPLLATQSASAAGTTIIRDNTSAGENQPGWYFNRDVSTSTPYEFNYNQASMGDGSLYVLPIGATPANKFIAENFLLTPMSNINSISYDYLIGSGGDTTDGQQFYMTIYANFGSSSATKFYDCRYNVIPTSGSTSSFSTKSFDPTQSYPVTTSGTSPYACPSSPAAMDSLSAGSTIRAFSLNVGDTSASDAGLDGYLDNVVVNTDMEGVTSYDFEPAALPICGTEDSSFDTFTLGSVNGQSGWSSTGSYDQAIVKNTLGYSQFGCKSLRISNAVTSGAFGDQTFSPSSINEAGEADATSNGLSGGTRQNHYEAQFDLASALATLQSGLSMSVSPDRGDGSRMSYLRFEDSPSGINVFFDDVQGTDSSANFVETQIASGLSRTPHTIKFVMDFVDGASNDVVKIYIDGNLIHSGTSWENYYRYDTEASAEQSPRTVDSLLFRVGGTAVPANANKGFLIDNVNVATSTPTPTPPTPPSGGGSGSTGDSGSTGGTGSGSNAPTATTTYIAYYDGNGDAVTYDDGTVATADENSTDEGEVKGESTNKSNSSNSDSKDADSENSSAFLGLGWWWIPIILVGIGIIYWAVVKRADSTSSSS